jgi:hypothetical protein
MSTGFPKPATDSERLAVIAGLISPCPEPGVYDGNDMCVCRSGEVFPCSTTQAAWLARGLDVAEENHRVLEPARRQFEADAAAWDEADQ